MDVRDVFKRLKHCYNRVHRQSYFIESRTFYELNTIYDVTTMAAIS